MFNTTPAMGVVLNTCGSESVSKDLSTLSTWTAWVGSMRRSRGAGTCASHRRACPWPDGPSSVARAAGHGWVRADRGLNVTAVAERRRPHFVGVWLSEEGRKVLDEYVSASGVSRSEIMRRMMAYAVWKQMPKEWKP